MTTGALTKKFAYQSQWDDLSRDIQEPTGFDWQISTAIISYLFGQTVFRGIPEFVSYFQEQDSLYVPAGVPLEVWDISVLHHDKEKELPWMVDDIELPDRILTRMLLPLGKVSANRFDQDGDFDHTLDTRNDRFTLTRSLGYALTTRRGDLDLRLSDLYRLMVCCKIPQVSFASGQTLRIWGFSDGEISTNIQGAPDLLDIFVRRAPFCARCRLIGKLAIDNNTLKRDGVNGRMITSHSLTLGCEETFVYETIGAFAERLLIGTLTVPPGQKLCIRSPTFERIYQEYCKVKKNGFELPKFVLAQMLAPYGYSIDISAFDSSKEIHISTYITNGELLLSSETGFVCAKTRGDLLVNLDLLGDMMIMARRSSLCLPDNQSFMIYDLDADELKMLKEKGDKELKLSVILARRNPLGFCWSLSDNWQTLYFNVIEAIGTNPGERLPVLEIKILPKASGASCGLALARPDGKMFIANIVNQSHPGLRQGLREMDPNAMTFLLVRAFAYYLCQDFRVFRSDEFPDFFRGEVREAEEIFDQEINDYVQVERIEPPTIDKLREKMNDPSLSQAIKEINASQELVNKLHTLLENTSPEKFDIERDKLPKPIRLLLQEIGDLAVLELRKSPFLKTVLPAFLATLPPEEDDADDGSTDKKDGT